MIRLPYPRRPAPAYTTLPSPAASTGSPALPPMSRPLFFASSKPATTGPLPGQIQASSSSPEAAAAGAGVLGADAAATGVDAALAGADAAPAAGREVVVADELATGLATATVSATGGTTRNT